MATQKQPAIVAELGRPETPDETAARKAENSRRHRSNQTLLNLVVALVASLAIVLFLVVVVVRPESTPANAIDYVAVAEEAQGATSEPLIAPALPDGWSANSAEFGTKSEVLDWYIGFVTPATQFIALDQGIDANPTWTAGILENARSTGAVTIDGLDWTIYDQRAAKDPGNFAYSMSTTIGSSTVLLHGTATTDEFQLLAAAIAAETGGQVMSERTPAEAWAEMVRGNERFVVGAPEHPRQDVERREALALAQSPHAALFGCSDSRLAAEIIFDRGIGDLFVVRNAGQIISESVIGSLEYAVGVLHVPLIVVLGHDECGAVRAAIDSQGEHAPVLPPHITTLISKIIPAVRRVAADNQPGEPVDSQEVGQEHLRDTIAELLDASELITDAIAAGTLAVVGANYRLLEGRAVPDVIVGSV